MHGVVVSEGAFMMSRGCICMASPFVVGASCMVSLVVGVVVEPSMRVMQIVVRHATVHLVLSKDLLHFFLSICDSFVELCGVMLVVDTSGGMMVLVVSSVVGEVVWVVSVVRVVTVVRVVRVTQAMIGKPLLPVFVLVGSMVRVVRVVSVVRVVFVMMGKPLLPVCINFCTVVFESCVVMLVVVAMVDATGGMMLLVVSVVVSVVVFVVVSVMRHVMGLPHCVHFCLIHLVQGLV